LVAEFNYLVDLGSGNIFQNESVPLGEDVFFNDITRGNAVLWNWDFGDGTVSNLQNPIHVYDQVGTYKVQLRVVDGIGCVSIYEMELTVKDDFEVIIPNAFTPGDVKNQYFKPEFRGIASMDFYIFNTWGELIYQTSSLEDRGWDGTLDGKLTPNGNYVYRGRFVSRGGKIIEKAGVFILIR
jgi:gliding motility-associated-like protein